MRIYLDRERDWSLPTRREAEREDDWPQPETYVGTCGGCGRHVSAMSEGGACLHRGGVWHPACRADDRRREAQETLL
jgi:hypothetical protein